MSEPAAPDTDTSPAERPLSSPDGAAPPMPYPGTTTARPLSSLDGTVPPMPSEATNARTQGPAAAGSWRAAMGSLRKMMHRTPPGAV